MTSSNYIHQEQKKSNQNITSLKDSRVLLRVCFDLPNVNSLDRINSAAKSIFQLLLNQNQVILATHWARPDTKNYNSYFLDTKEKKEFDENQDFAKLSTKNILESVKKALLEQVTKTNLFGQEKSQEIISKVEKLFFWNQYTANFQNPPKNSLILLENTRFHPFEQKVKEPEAVDLAKKYASLADYFVDEAFAVSHRSEVSNDLVSNYLPSFFGLDFTKETEALYSLKDFAKDTLVIMGGAKLETKIPLVSKLISSVKYLVITGKLAPTFLEAKSLLLNKNLSVYPKDWIEKEYLSVANSLLVNFPEKIILPLPYVVENNKPLDLSSEAILNLKPYLNQVKAVFWNGPVGYYEDPEYAKGTTELANLLLDQQNLYTVIGGGDTVECLSNQQKAGFNHISMGGGATLEFLSKIFG